MGKHTVCTEVETKFASTSHHSWGAGREDLWRTLETVSLLLGQSQCLQGEGHLNAASHFPLNCVESNLNASMHWSSL